MSNPSDFWDRIAKKYAAQPVADQSSYEYKLKTTQSYLRPDMDVLEFGCGTGTTALAHAPFVKSIRALDFSSAMIDIAQGKARDQQVSNVSFETGAFETLNVPDESYDVVLGMSVLHLLADEELALRRVYDLLKPGGLFISSTICIGDMGLVKWVLPLATALRLAPMVNVFSARELIASHKSAGFEIELEWRPKPSRALFVIARKPGKQTPP